MAILQQIVACAVAHTDLVSTFVVLAFLARLYLKGEAKGLWPFLQEMLSEWDPRLGKMVASSKRMVLLLAACFVLWGYTRLTIAVCEWIARPGNDPTHIYMTITLGVLALAGVTYLGGSWINKLIPAIAPGGPAPDPTAALPAAPAAE